MIEHWSRMVFLKPGILDLIDVAVVTFIVFERWFLVPLPKGPIEELLGF